MYDSLLKVFGMQDLRRISLFWEVLFLIQAANGYKVCKATFFWRKSDSESCGVGGQVRRDEKEEEHGV
ncbi:hypothetical protein B9G55_22490 [Saccharibacillus sp. O16]|nr:hypothetical protein B9G55_22490 [Saccharibacillus sp. O16]